MGGEYPAGGPRVRRAELWDLPSVPRTSCVEACAHRLLELPQRALALLPARKSIPVPVPTRVARGPEDERGSQSAGGEREGSRCLPTPAPPASGPGGAAGDGEGEAGVWTPERAGDSPEHSCVSFGGSLQPPSLRPGHSRFPSRGVCCRARTALIRGGEDCPRPCKNPVVEAATAEESTVLKGEESWTAPGTCRARGGGLQNPVVSFPSPKSSPRPDSLRPSCSLAVVLLQCSASWKVGLLRPKRLPALRSHRSLPEISRPSPSKPTQGYSSKVCVFISLAAVYSSM